MLLYYLINLIDHPNWMTHPDWMTPERRKGVPSTSITLGGRCTDSAKRKVRGALQVVEFASRVL